MRITQLPRCFIGMHHRDRKRVWNDNGKRRSVCDGCGVPMAQSWSSWHVDPDGPKRRPDRVDNPS